MPQPAQAAQSQQPPPDNTLCGNYDPTLPETRRMRMNTSTWSPKPLQHSCISTESDFACMPTEAKGDYLRALFGSAEFRFVITTGGSARSSSSAFCVNSAASLRNSSIARTSKLWRAAAKQRVAKVRKYTTVMMGQLQPPCPYSHRTLRRLSGIRHKDAQKSSRPSRGSASCFGWSLPTFRN